MTRSLQLPLDLALRPALGRDDLLVTRANAEAVAWIDRWPDWPAPALVLVGPSGSGKTHLAQVWRARSGAEVFSPKAGGPPPAGPVVVEDAERCGAGDIALFHLYNDLAASGHSMLVTAASPPARWRDRLPDLISRLAAAPTATIRPPDDEIIAAILVKLFADRQLRVDASVIAYLLARMERSYAAARRVVAALDSAALAARREITVPLARVVLADVGEDEP